MDLFTGIVLLDENQRIYLIKEDDKNQIGQDRWNLPGGRVESEENLTESAWRETLEETGYNAEIKFLIGCYKGRKGAAVWLYLVFAAEIRNSARVEPTDPAIKAGRWFSQDKFLNMDDALLVHVDIKKVYRIALESGGLSLETVQSITY